MSAPTTLPGRAAPLTYAQALAAATASRAAGVSQADVVRAAAEQVIVRREATAARTVAQTLRLLHRTDPYDGHAVGGFVSAALKILREAQVAVARWTAAGQAVQLRAAGVYGFTPVLSLPDEVRGIPRLTDAGTVEITHAARTLTYSRPPSGSTDHADGDGRDGDGDRGRTRSSVTVRDDTITEKRPRSRVRVSAAQQTTEDALNRPAREYRRVKAEGGTDEQAQAAADTKVVRVVEDNLMLSQRTAEAEVMAQVNDLDHRVIGYRRILHPELSRGGACGLCVAAADQLYKVSELKPIHANCKCTVAAVTKDFDPRVVNDEDLAKVVDAAKGTDAASLKRVRVKEDEHGELGVVLAPAAEHKSRKERAEQREAARRDAAGKPKTPTAPKKLSDEEFAANQIRVLEQKLAELEADGQGDSKPAKWQRKQLAKYRAQVGDGSASDRGSAAAAADTKPTSPPTAGGDDGGNDNGNGNGRTGFGDPHDDIVERIALDAESSERDITAAVRGSTSESNGELTRLDTKLKSRASIAEKLERLQKRGAGPDEIRDALRYTWVAHSDESYWASADAVIERLVADGHTVLRDPAGWNSRAGAYRGRNVELLSPSGDAYELQFHTRDSLAAAERAHRLYEKERAPGVGSSEKKRLKRAQREIFENVAWPADVPRV